MSISCAWPLVALILEALFRNEIVIRMAKMNKTDQIPILFEDEEILRSLLNPLFKIVQSRRPITQPRAMLNAMAKERVARCDDADFIIGHDKALLRIEGVMVNRQLSQCIN
ncbi:hypothetical protein BLX42_03140 [Pseudomonas sp. SG-MS2]|nr:hypothetical protein BLX42_03140 [Pseudomonas sp. SG-MS2]